MKKFNEAKYFDEKKNKELTILRIHKDIRCKLRKSK